MKSLSDIFYNTIRSTRVKLLFNRRSEVWASLWYNELLYGWTRLGNLHRWKHYMKLKCGDGDGAPSTCHPFFSSISHPTPFATLKRCTNLCATWDAGKAPDTLPLPTPPVCKVSTHQLKANTETIKENTKLPFIMLLTCKGKQYPIHIPNIMQSERERVERKCAVISVWIQA